MQHWCLRRIWFTLIVKIILEILILAENNNLTIINYNKFIGNTIENETGNTLIFMNSSNILNIE